MRSITLLPLLALVGCATQPSFTPAERLAGDWTCSMDGSRVHLEADGDWIYHFTDEAGPTTQPGSFEATWKTISFQSDVGSCSDVVGSYEYELSRDTLLFTLKKDDCPGREIRMEYAWTRMMTPDIPAVADGELEAIKDE
ncbi:MAG: hypothetical protein P8M22_08030 [Phycisphaerales bacterium]|nr:hypothetical protein [Phycisphaerales bacterium]